MLLHRADTQRCGGDPNTVYHPSKTKRLLMPQSVTANPPQEARRPGQLLSLSNKLLATHLSRDTMYFHHSLAQFLRPIHFGLGPARPKAPLESTTLIHLILEPAFSHDCDLTRVHLGPSALVFVASRHYTSVNVHLSGSHKDNTSTHQRCLSSQFGPPAES